jgi:hypothetical protein
VINLKELTLDDEGYYFCQVDQMGQTSTVSDLSQLIMWATPNPPEIAMDSFFYSNDVKTNETANSNTPNKYQQSQLVAECTSTEGHPPPSLTFFDVTTGAKLTTEADVKCLDDSYRPAVKNCRLELKFVVTKEHDKNQYRCEMTHPSLDQKMEKVATINVHYPPHSLQMRGNRTEKTITCSAIANPPPTYYYKVGRTGSFSKIEDAKGKQYINRLDELPPNDVIYCRADNKVSPKAESFRRCYNYFHYYRYMLLSKT